MLVLTMAVSDDDDDDVDDNDAAAQRVQWRVVYHQPFSTRPDQEVLRAYGVQTSDLMINLSE